MFYQVKDKLEEHKKIVFSSNYNLYGDMSRRVIKRICLIMLIGKNKQLWQKQ